jgi:hypothetical protein
MPPLQRGNDSTAMVGEISPFHSLTRILAKKRRKLVRRPGYNSYRQMN